MLLSQTAWSLRRQWKERALIGQQPRGLGSLLMSSVCESPLPISVHVCWFVCCLAGFGFIFSPPHHLNCLVVTIEQTGHFMFFGTVRSLQQSWNNEQINHLYLYFFSFQEFSYLLINKISLSACKSPYSDKLQFIYNKKLPADVWESTVFIGQFK